MSRTGASVGGRGGMAAEEKRDVETEVGANENVREFG